nr:hypothetical protein [Tanacetum cinerariifolium]
MYTCLMDPHSVKMMIQQHLWMVERMDLQTYFHQAYDSKHYQQLFRVGVEPECLVAKHVVVKSEERVISTTPNKRNRTSKVDGYQEPKQGIYPRNLPDSRSRAASISAHSSTPKPEQRRKIIRVVNTIGVREEYTAGALTNAKLVRGPRSGPMVAARFCIVQAPTSNDRELPNTTGKNGDLLVTNRKRTLSTCSSSSPVTQRADRRPQKISRSVRRTNIVPVVPSNDDITSLDSGTENGSGFVKRVLGSIQSVVPTPKPDLDSSRDIMLDI